MITYLSRATSLCQLPKCQGRERVKEVAWAGLDNGAWPRSGVRRAAQAPALLLLRSNGGQRRRRGGLAIRGGQPIAAGGQRAEPP
jgi:hypothetical protein